MYDMKALYEAESVENAVALRLEHPEAQIIAGGSDVLVQMREGKRAGKELISIYGLDELRAAIGAVPLEELFMMTFNHILLTLVERRRRLHPATVEVWNHYVARSRDAKAEKGTA